jgi:hypothetical protein
MQEVNRSAMIVIGKQPFLKWLRSIDPSNADLILDEINRKPVVYLIPECESDDEFELWLERRFRAVFEEQLVGWWTDESAWPPRTFALFRRWFDCRLYSLVLDAGAARLAKI